MNSNKIILIGAGGHCKSCIDIIEEEGKFDIHGILDPNLNTKSVLGYPVIGDDNLIPDLNERGFHFLITVGQIKSSLIRKNIFKKLLVINASLPTIISPRAYLSKYAKVGVGTILHHNTIINAGAVVGENCIINNGAIVEHDSKIGDNCHVSTRVIVNGNCVIGNNVFVGSGSVISNNIFIHDNVVIGASSLVYKSINQEGVYLSQSGIKNI